MLQEVEFDHRDIEEEALVERYYTDASGKERLAKIVDRDKLKKLVKKRNAEGRKVMEPFRIWCVRFKGLTPTNADRKGALAYIAIWDTYNRPWEKLLREDITQFKKNELRRALHLFGEWLSLEGHTEEDKQWGRRILANTARLKAAGGKKKVIVCKGKRTKEEMERDRVYPLTRDEWGAIFLAIEQWHKRKGIARPWARDFFRMRFKCGLHHRNTGVHYLNREDVGRALEEAETRKKSAVVKLWIDTSHPRLIPVRFVKKELESLYNFPAAWGILADLIAPYHDDENARIRGAKNATSRVWREIMLGSGGKVRNDAAWYKQAKYAAIREAWKRSHDKFLLESMFGYSKEWFDGLPWLD